MYVVIELQTNSYNETSTIVTTHEDLIKAESKFHSILAAAAESSVYIHAASILNDRGELERSEYYNHS